MLSLLLALVLPCSAAPAPRALALARDVRDVASSPDGRTAFFVAPITGRAELWRASWAGGWPQQLTENGDVSDPQLSPDGRVVAYSAGSDLYLMPAGGGTPSNLTRSRAAELAPRFSPGGRRLAYLSDAPGDLQLFVRDLETGAARALTSGGAVATAPAWSPDGRRLACGRGGAVLLVDAERGGTKALVTGAERVLSVSWSPRGDRLLAVVEAAGRRRMLLLSPSWTSPRPAGPSEWEATKAAWTPEGVLVLRRAGERGALQLLPDRGAPKTLSAPDDDVEDFALSADGESVLVFLREGPRSLLIARLPVDP